MEIKWLAGKMAGMKYAHNPVSDPIGRHTRALIHWLENKIEKDFGYTVQLGFEKEFWLDVDPPVYHSDVVGGIEQRRKDAVRAIRKKLNNDSVKPVVERFYKESPGNKYELAIAPAAPLQAVHRVDTQCSLLEQCVAQKEQFTAGDSRRMAERARRQHATDEPTSFVITSVSFSPYQERYSTAGLHVNFSVWDHEGHNLMALDRAPKLSGEQHAKIRQTLYRYICADSVLIAPDEVAFERRSQLPLFWKDKKGGCCRDKCSRNHARPKEMTLEKAHVEFRTPAANARHDLAALMALSAIYNGLNDKYKALSAFSEAPHGLADAADRFRRSSELFKDLEYFAQSDPDIAPIVDELRTALQDAAEKGRLTQPVWNAEQATQGMTI